MTRLVSALAVGLILAAATHLYAQGRANPAQSRDAIENNWRFDYQQALQEATAAKKPLMVVLRCVP